MFRSFSITLVAVMLVVAVVSAEDKAASKKPVGTWVREAGGNKMIFDIKPDNLTFTLTTSDGGEVTGKADYGVTREGVLFACMTETSKKGTDGGPGKGDLFSFTIEVKGKEMTISDLKGTHTGEEARKIVEGTYTNEKK